MPPPVTALTFYLTLPRALPWPEDEVSVSGIERDRHWDGWSDDDVGELLGLSPGDERELPSGLVPNTGIALRHCGVADLPETFVAAQAFGEGGGHEADQEAVTVVRTVAAVRRFIPRFAHPAASEMTGAWLHTQFRIGLADLNGFLEAFGFVYGSWTAGPVSLRELPSRVPAAFATTEGTSVNHHLGIDFIAQIHDGGPVAVEGFATDADVAARATALNNRAASAEQPYMLVFKFFASAESEREAGDLSRAVIDLNTAFELTVRLTLHHGNQLLGVPEAEALEAHEANLKLKVRRYLAEMLGKEIDTRDESGPWGRWFEDGYKMRNLAVHEGATLTSEDVERAFSQVSEVFADLQRSLETVPELTRLGRDFEIDPRPGPPLPNDELIGLAFFWE
jgi:hypothetical protein